MTHINIFRTSKKFLAKTIITTLFLLINFTQASEIAKVTPENLQPQTISDELTIFGQFQMFQFPNQQEYLVLCTINKPKNGEDSRKIYKGPLDWLTQLFEGGYFHTDIFKRQKCNHLNIITTIGSFTNDNFYDEKAPDFPAWYDNLKDQYFPLTPFIPTDDVLDNMVMKDIDEEALRALGREGYLKEIEMIGLSEEEASQKRILLESSTQKLISDSDAAEDNSCIIF